MLGRGVNEEIPHLKPEEMWGDLLPIMKAADARIINLECAVTRHKRAWVRTPKVFHFRADPQAVEVLKAADITACSLANNHILDFEEEGLLDTIVYLSESKILFAGAGRNLNEAQKPTYLPIFPNKTIALFAMTDNQPEFAAKPNTPGTNYFPVDLDVGALYWIERTVDEARKEGAELIILSNHWGPNMVERPSTLFRRFAEATIDRGVDIYHGHSAHNFQGIEIYKGKPILYDTGDLIDDYAVDPLLHNDWSFLFRVTFEGPLLHQVELIPVELSYARVETAKPPNKDKILNRMMQLSAELGTQLKIENNELIMKAG